MFTAGRNRVMFITAQFISYYKRLVNSRTTQLLLDK